MKKAALGIFAIAALIGTPALAADMAVKAPPPPPVPAWSWTGCHIGGDVGFSELSSNGYYADSATTIGGVAGTFTGPLSTPLSSSGATGGAYAGCDYQVNSWVIGVEGDWSSLNQSSTGGIPAGALLNPGDFWTQHEQWFVTARGRLGYAADRWLTYVTGGVAWMGVQTSTGITGVPAAALTQTDTATGWTIGAGVEYALRYGFILRAEYLFVGIPSYRTFTPGTGSATALTGDFLNIGASRISDNIFRVGLSYKFGSWGFGNN